MALETRTYTYEDLKELDIEQAPYLDLEDLVIDQCLVPSDGGQYMLFLTHQRADSVDIDCCPVCKSKSIKKDGTSKPRLVHDVIRNNQRVDIIIKPMRFTCKDCGARFGAKIEGIEESRQMTTRLYDFLKVESFLQPFTNLAERSGFSVATISTIFDEEIDRIENERREKGIPAPRVLGIDEKHIGRIMRGTLVDIETGKLIEILPDNKGDTMKEGIKQFAGWDTKIEVVTTDMNNAYLSWLNKLLPNATVVIDKFHVVKDVNKRVKDSRNKLIASLKKQVDKIEDEEERNRKKNALMIVRTTPRLFSYTMARIARDPDSNLADKLATVISEFREFNILHNLHYAIEYIYASTSREEAEERYDEWLEILPPHADSKYKEWCDMYDVNPEYFDGWRSFNGHFFKSFRPYILNYFNPGCRYTNAATEGLNRLIDQIYTAGSGYSFKHLRAKCLYAPLVHEQVNYSVKMVSIPKWKFSAQQIVGSPIGPSTLSQGSEPVYEFDETIFELSIPELNIYSDNEWLPRLLSSGYAAEQKQFMDEINKTEDILSMFNESDVEDLDWRFVINDDEFEEDYEFEDDYEEDEY